MTVRCHPDRPLVILSVSEGSFTENHLTIYKHENYKNNFSGLLRLRLDLMPAGSEGIHIGTV